MGADIKARTPGGLIAYCDWLSEKGYQSANAVEAWKVAVRKVFAAVEPDTWQDTSLDGLDLDEYADRFRTLAGHKYRSETITVYQRRIKNAMHAQAYYIENNSPPNFKKPRRRSARAEAPAAGQKPGRPESSNVVAIQQPQPDYFELDYPLDRDRSAYMRLPKSMSKREIERISAVIKTLEETPQIPEQTGQAA